MDRGGGLRQVEPLVQQPFELRDRRGGVAVPPQVLAEARVRNPKVVVGADAAPPQREQLAHARLRPG
jgi:hypothetical protein